MSVPGKSWQNGADGSFNGKFRDERLPLEWFRSREEAAVIIEARRRHYNAVPPYSCRIHMTPHELNLHNPDHPNRAVLQQ